MVIYKWVLEKKVNDFKEEHIEADITDIHKFT